MLILIDFSNYYNNNNNSYNNNYLIFKKVKIKRIIKK